MSNPTDYDVVVVGAGFGGVITARDLTERGYRVALLEARDRPGGRAWSRPFKDRSDVVEMGGTWVSTAFMPGFAREIERYSTDMKQTRPPEHTVFLTGGERRSGLPVPAEDLGFVDRANTRMITAASRISPHLPFDAQQASDLDVSSDEFFASCELSLATKELVDGLLSTWCGSKPGEVSMLHLLGWLAGLGGTPYLALYESLVDKFTNGASGMVQDIIDASGFEVRFSTPVTAVIQQDDLIIVETADGEIRADACVVAVPTNTFGAIRFDPPLSSAKQEALDAGHACLPYKVQMIVENVPEGIFGLGMGAFQMLLSDHPLQDGSHLVCGFGAQSVVELDLTDRHAVESALREYVPEARLIEYDAHDWNADPWSRGGWRMNPPGWAQSFSSIMHKPEGGRLFFAGTDVAETVLAGWMEGAIVSGYRAADRVTALLAKQRQQHPSAASA